MIVTIADMIAIMEQIAPSYLAEKWDNSGLQIGQKDWPVHNVLIALDPLPEVISAACQANIDMLITHHPLFFKPLKSIDFKTPSGFIINMAARHKLGIFSAHTNLDSVLDGINDELALKIGLKNLDVLGKEIKSETCKLCVYVPFEYESAILNALFETTAGKIDNYTCCSFRNKGIGTFKPDELAVPFMGKTGEISHVNEIRIEAVVLKNDIYSVIEHLRKHHPYETMAYDVFPLDNTASKTLQGLGRVGDLYESLTLESLGVKIKNDLGLQCIKIAGKPDMQVNKVALCSGSGSSLMKDFFASGAQVYVSGDLHYHDARDAEIMELGLIDIGHFASEHLMVKVLAKRLQNILAENKMDVNVKPFCEEKDPFTYI